MDPPEIIHASETQNYYTSNKFKQPLNLFLKRYILQKQYSPAPCPEYWKEIVVNPPTTIFACSNATPKNKNTSLSSKIKQN